MPRDRKENGALDQTELCKHPGYLLARARWQAFRNFERSIGRPFDLRPVEYSVLLLLDSNAEATQSQLALALGVAAPNMTGILRRLEGRGLIERLRSETDKRMQHIALTSGGRKLLADAVAASRSMDKAWLGRLSRAEQGMLMELLAKLSAAPGQFPAKE